MSAEDLKKKVKLYESDDDNTWKAALIREIMFNIGFNLWFDIGFNIVFKIGFNIGFTNQNFGSRKMFGQEKF